MKKKILIVLLAALVAGLIFAGCEDLKELELLGGWTFGEGGQFPDYGLGGDTLGPGDPSGRGVIGDAIRAAPAGAVVLVYFSGGPATIQWGTSHTDGLTSPASFAATALDSNRFNMWGGTPSAKPTKIELWLEK